MATLLQAAQGEGTAVGGHLSQQEMAAMTGTTREVVARSLRTLEQQGALRVERGRIVILRPEVLERLV